jgi:hypothetical protein
LSSFSCRIITSYGLGIKGFTLKKFQNRAWMLKESAAHEESWTIQPFLSQWCMFELDDFSSATMAAAGMLCEC